MIIFELDGVLADCEHRRHFVDPDKNKDYEVAYVHNEETRNWNGKYRPGFCDFSDMPMGDRIIQHKITKELFKPDWDAFHEACDKDTPIQPVIDIWDKEISLGMMGIHQIWTGRSESARKNTEKWLDFHLLCFQKKQLKIRFTGDHTPYEQLKERWLNGVLSSGKTIEYVFDSHPESIRMWRRHGIFVFNCNQSKEEF